MFEDLITEAWAALRRNPTRSILTMLGITWGVVAVSLLLSYGSGFRSILMGMFEAFGHNAVVVWPGTTSDQAGGERAGRVVHFEKADIDLIRARATLVKHVSPETTHAYGISYGSRLVDTVVRGVDPNYGEMRNEIPSQGRWISDDDMVNHRPVIFLGADLRKKLFAGRPCVDQTVRVNGVRFTVIGTMERKFQMGNYFTSDDDSAWIPYTAASDMWDTRYARVIVFTPIFGQFEKGAIDQVKQIIPGGTCHLDAKMIERHVAEWPLASFDLLIIENVGNLVCPASFQLGTHKSVLIASIPEGDDKPYKYPGMYRGVDALVLNKIDLLPYVPFDMDYFLRGVEVLNPGLVTFNLSCRTGEGLEAWLDWLLAQVKK